MSVVAQAIVFDNSRSKGVARLVHHCLASYVSYEKWETQGEPPVAYPSQSTLARKCNCTRQAVNRALKDLQELDEIRDTGDTWLRGTIIWELTLVDRVHSGVPPVTKPDMSTDVTGGDRSRNALSNPASDLSHLYSDLSHPDSAPVSEGDTRWDVKKASKKVNEDGSSADALDVGSPFGEGNSNGNGNGPVLRESDDTPLPWVDDDDPPFPDPGAIEAKRQAELKELEDSKSEYVALLVQRPDDQLLAQGLATVEGELAALGEEVVPS